MLQRQELFEDLRLAFAVLRGYIQPGGSLNLSDVNIHAEDFVGEVLNKLYGCNLTPTRKLAVNYPGIDLIDTSAGTGIQVTAEKGVGKINSTLETLDEHGLNKIINKLRVFELLGRQTSYAVKASCAGIAFSWKVDVMDFDTTLEELLSASDEILRGVHSYVTSEMPSIFASRWQKLETIRDRLRDNLIVFDRDVLRVAEQHEDPVRMCRAIREMRVELQKSGASYIDNEVAKVQFATAKKLLGETERAIRDRFPYIHKAAENQSDILPHAAYSGTDYSDSIQQMMGLRQKLGPCLKALEAELKRVESLL